MLVVIKQRGLLFKDNIKQCLTGGLCNFVVFIFAQLIQNGEYDLVESKGFQTVNDEECLLPDEVFGTNGAEEDSG